MEVSQTTLSLTLCINMEYKLNPIEESQKNTYVHVHVHVTKNVTVSLALINFNIHVFSFGWI